MTLTKCHFAGFLASAARGSSSYTRGHRVSVTTDDGLSQCHIRNRNKLFYDLRTDTVTIRRNNSHRLRRRHHLDVE